MKIISICLSYVRLIFLVKPYRACEVVGRKTYSLESLDDGRIKKQGGVANQNFFKPIKKL